MKNPWKFESSQKLSSKVSNASSSPVVCSRHEGFPAPSKEGLPGASKSDLEGFWLQAEEKAGARGRRGKGLAAKMKAKAQEQLRGVHRQLEEREGELGGVAAEAEAVGQVVRERRRAGEELVNNEQMLQFKEKQLSNLMTIHAELLETARKDILNEKAIKFAHDEKVVGLKKRITDFNSRAIERRHLRGTVEALTQERARLEEQLRARRETEARRSEIRSEAIRDLLHELVRRNRRELEEECERKVRAVRDSSASVKNYSELRPLLHRNGIPPSDYYTFGQLKYVQELNFRADPEAEKAMRIFYREVNPKIPEIIEHFEEPEEFIKLKEELASLEKAKVEKEAELKKRQGVLELLEQQKAQLKKTIAQLKVKTQIK